MHRSLFGELHPRDALLHAWGQARALLGMPARRANVVSPLPPLPCGESGPETLPPINTEGFGSSRLFAGFDLQLRQGRT